MRIKRLLHGSAIAVLAVLSWAVAGSAGTSASIGISNIKVDTKAQQVVVTPGAKDKEVLFSVAKKGSNGKTGKTTFKMSAWDVHDVTGNGNIVMDLSKLNATKENFIAVMTGDMDKPFIIKIPASDKVNVLTYDAQKHELEFKAGDSKGNAVAATSFEYRTQNGKWSEVQELEKGIAKNIFEQYQFQGASLYVRTCNVQKDKLEADAYYSNVYDASNLDNKLDVYVAGKLPGKVSKLNIAKQANGPAVSVQYTAGTLTLPKAAEYRLLVKGEDGSYNFKEFDTTKDGQDVKEKIVSTDATTATKGVRIDTMFGTTDNPATSGAIGVLEIRTKAKENNSSPQRAKCASKWTRIGLEVTAPLTVPELGGAATMAAASAVGEAASGGAGIANAVVLNKDGKKVVSVQYGDSSEGTDGKWKGKIRFTNIGDDEYQIIAVENEVKDIAELEKVKGAIILAAGSSSTKIATLSDVKNESYIYIRKAGNQSKKKWVGVYTLFGRADIPKK